MGKPRIKPHLLGHFEARLRTAPVNNDRPLKDFLKYGLQSYVQKSLLMEKTPLVVRLKAATIALVLVSTPTGVNCHIFIVRFPVPGTTWKVILKALLSKAFKIILLVLVRRSRG